MLRRIVLALAVLVLVISAVGTTKVRSQSACTGADQYPAGKPVRTMTHLAIQRHPKVIQYGTDTSGEILDVTFGGDIVMVLGQTCDGDILFLYVDYEGTIGWMQAYSKGGEGRDPGPTVEMVEDPPCGTLVVGEIGKIIGETGSGLWIYQNPGNELAGPMLGQIARGETVMVFEKFCASTNGTWIRILYNNLNGWILEERNGQYFVVSVNLPSCPIHSITVDSQFSEGVVEGKVLGTDPCDATIEIHNTRSYWVNLKITPLGGSKAEPVGGDANLYAKFGILGPDASVHYNVHFPKLGRSIEAEVDTTFGSAAKMMNFTQFVIDAISLRQPGVGTGFTLLTDYYPTLADTYASTPNLRDAMNAFFDNDFVRFNAAMQRAADKQEFIILGAALKKLGIAGGEETISKLFKRVGRSLEIVEIIWRNADNVSAFLSGKSTHGALFFIAQ